MTEAAELRDRYVAQYRRFAANGGGREAGWLKQLREAAMARFAAAGFPTTRQEEWRFTDLGPLVRAGLAVAEPSPAPLLPEDAVTHLLDPTAPRVVVVDGAFSPQLSSSHGLPPSLRLGSLAEAIERGNDVVAGHLGRYAQSDRNPFAALCTGFMRDGAFIHVPPGVTPDCPVQVLFLTTRTAHGTVTHPRSLVILEREAALTVVETYAALDGGTYLTNAVSEVVLGEGARGQVVRIQRESPDAYHIATAQSHQARGSQLVCCTVVLSGGLGRHDLNSVLDGPGSRLQLDALTVASGQQHVDHHTTIDHAQPHCESHELVNGIFDGHARGVFNGRIIVRPGAQQTDSKQTNNNVLLSATARADSQPQLEIYADDVKCTHGATIGPLDPQILFYLRARGIGADAARQLVTYGLAADVLSHIGLPSVRDRLDALVRDRLRA